MNSISENITKLRKARNWSQDELAKRIGSSRVMIGKYERGDNMPSVEVMVRLTEALEVSLDYLVGQSDNITYDKEMISRLENVEKLPQEEKSRIFHFIDLIIRDFKAKQAYG